LNAGRFRNTVSWLASSFGVRFLVRYRQRYRPSEEAAIWLSGLGAAGKPGRLE
jgi:hypothetical protein